MKIVYSDPKSGRSGNLEVSVEQSAVLLNRKVGDMIDGNLIGMPGYKLKITGGSDKSGFPIDRSIDGTRKATVFKTISNSGSRKGEYHRQSVRGNTISVDIMQLNVSVVEYGDKPIEEMLPPKKEKEAKPKAEKADKAEKPEKKEAKAESKPAAEPAKA